MTREEFIKKKIREKGMTLKDYARTIGMPYSTLLSMLAGNLCGASLDNVCRICNGLDVSIGILQTHEIANDGESKMEDLSQHEKQLVSQYRNSTAMQVAVDKLLDL